MGEAFHSLRERLAALRPKGAGWIKLRSATWTADDLVLGLEVGETGRPADGWRIHCRDVRDSRIVDGPATLAIGFEERHPVLLPYTEPAVQLFFRGTCADADRVVGQLYDAHRSVVGDWLDFRRFLNPAASTSLADLLRGGFGSLAAGPQPLVERYADVLRRNDLTVSSPPPAPPEWRRWRERGTDVAEPERPPRVLLLNSFYVVTPEVTAERA